MKCQLPTTLVLFEVHFSFTVLPIQHCMAFRVLVLQRGTKLPWSPSSHCTGWWWWKGKAVAALLRNIASLSLYDSFIHSCVFHCNGGITLWPSQSSRAAMVSIIAWRFLRFRLKTILWRHYFLEAIWNPDLDANDAHWKNWAFSELILTPDFPLVSGSLSPPCPFPLSPPCHHHVTTMLSSRVQPPCHQHGKCVQTQLSQGDLWT